MHCDRLGCFAYGLHTAENLVMQTPMYDVSGYAAFHEQHSGSHGTGSVVAVRISGQEGEAVID